MIEVIIATKHDIYIIMIVTLVIVISIVKGCFKFAHFS